MPERYSSDIESVICSAERGQQVSPKSRPRRVSSVVTAAAQLGQHCSSVADSTHLQRAGGQQPQPQQLIIMPSNGRQLVQSACEDDPPLLSCRAFDKPVVSMCSLSG